MNVIFPSMSPVQSERADLFSSLQVHYGPCTIWRTAGKADLLLFAPCDWRETYLLMTCGVSERPMTVPCAVPERIELMLSLPADWPVDRVDSDEAMWPFHLLGHLSDWLKDHWVAPGHVLDLASALHGTSFAHVVISPTLQLDVDAIIMGDQQVVVYSVIPVFEGEAHYVRGRSQGGMLLVNRLLDAGYGEVVSLSRPYLISASELHTRVLH